MTKADFFKEFKKNYAPDLTLGKIEELVKGVFKLITELVKEDQVISIEGMRFKKRIRKEHFGVNPRTQEKITIPEKTYVVCKKELV